MRELMMDSQWISNVYGRKPPSEYLHRTNKTLFDEAVRLALGREAQSPYRSMRESYESVVSFQSTEYENCTLRPAGGASVMSTRCAALVDTFAAMILSPLYSMVKDRCVYR
jgi:hypothetical protein